MKKIIFFFPATIFLISLIFSQKIDFFDYILKKTAFFKKNFVVNNVVFQEENSELLTIVDKQISSNVIPPICLVQNITEAKIKKCNNLLLNGKVNEEWAIKNQSFKLAAFKNKVNKHLQTSVKIALNKSSLLQQQMLYSFGRNVNFFLEINKSGLIKNFILLESSGMPELDLFIKELIYSVEPFPKIPDHLNLESLVLGGEKAIF